MHVLPSLNAFQQWRKSLPNEKKIAFVPTMGALHQGHMSLIKSALNHTDVVIASIFVNPTQFNNAKDFEKYPKTIENDVKMLEKIGCLAVFIPEVIDVYPKGLEKIKLDLGILDEVMEGEHRRGHFQGVVTVVHRLFEIVKPDLAFFGEKDFQQVAVIKLLTAKLHPQVKIKTVTTMREKDGLAMSSRNMRLEKKYRDQAPTIYKLLLKAQDMFYNNDEIDEIKRQINIEFSYTSLKLEYFSIVNSNTLKIPLSHDEPCIACVAAYAGEVRLIDNIVLSY